ncbi:DUF3709 domain-containing protein [Vibrio mimicus]|uniref:DUF3709 domain-containing protein n=1 Tax=Vibrio mimicus TaxID=674 RepID=UPI003A914D0B
MVFVPFSISFRFCLQFNIVCRCTFQRDCLIELLCQCVVSGFVGEGFSISRVDR